MKSTTLPLPSSALMKIAIPMAADAFCEHFGAAREFLIFAGNRSEGAIGDGKRLAAPEHKPGALPAWLEAQQADALVASAIGERALIMLADAGIEVFLANGSTDPAELAAAALAGQLPRANHENPRCQGGHHDHEGHGCQHH